MLLTRTFAALALLAAMGIVPGRRTERQPLLPQTFLTVASEALNKNAALAALVVLMTGGVASHRAHRTAFVDRRASALLVKKTSPRARNGRGHRTIHSDDNLEIPVAIHNHVIRSAASWSVRLSSREAPNVRREEGRGEQNQRRGGGQDRITGRRLQCAEESSSVAGYEPGFDRLGGDVAGPARMAPAAVVPAKVRRNSRLLNREGLLHAANSHCHLQPRKSR